MKKLSFLALTAVVAICLTSCVSSKKIIYFQGADSIYAQAQQIQQKYEMKLKPADQVLIKVTCDSPELLEIFSSDVIMGSASNRSGSIGSYASGSMTNAYGYTVDNNGELTLPVIGKVQVEHLTCDEAAIVIEDAIKAQNIIKEPDVTVRLMNARVTVLGAVKAPKVVTLSSERNTVLDVLSQCGDVSDQALRQSVTLFREEDGVRTMYHMDLTQADIFTNPAFYVQQNDLVYVQPNKSQNVKSSAFSTFLSSAASIVGFITSITALIISLTTRK